MLGFAANTDKCFMNGFKFLWSVFGLHGRMCLTGAVIAAAKISAEDFGSVVMARFEVARPYPVYGNAIAAARAVI
jgi:hypothetical protein